MKLSLTFRVVSCAFCLGLAGTLAATDTLPPTQTQEPIQIQIKARRDLAAAPISPMMRKIIDASWGFYSSQRHAAYQSSGVDLTGLLEQAPSSR